MNPQSWLVLGVAALAIATPPRSMRGQDAPDTLVARHRAAFDFLVGSWRVVSRTDRDASASSIDEVYTFSKGLNGVLILGAWRFNRGTATQPDVVEAAYYSAYDTRAHVWSFYYVSPQSAQFWPGVESRGQWQFTRSFTLADTSFVQRQWWERIDENTIDRHVDNSVDGGVTWRPLTIRLRRRPQ